MERSAILNGNNIETSSRRFAEIQLAKQLASGDPTALDQVIEKYGDQLRRLIGNLTAWCPEVDDLFQETLLRAWIKAGSYRGESSLETWLSSIAVHICRNHFRTTQRLFKHLRNFWFTKDRDERNRYTKTLGGQSESDSQCELVQAGMQRLKPKDRELLVLTYIEQWSLDVVASHLGITNEALHVRLHRARNRLKKLMEETTQS